MFLWGIRGGVQSSYLELGERAPTFRYMPPPYRASLHQYYPPLHPQLAWSAGATDRGQKSRNVDLWYGALKCICHSYADLYCTCGIQGCESALITWRIKGER